MHKILVADSSAYFLRTTTMALQREGYDVLIAKDGRELLALASRIPDLIMVDFRLPDISGVKVCQALNRNSPTANIPVIITLGDNENPGKDVPSTACFLNKPIQTGAMIQMINQRLFPAPQANQEVTLFTPNQPEKWKTTVLRQVSSKTLLVKLPNWSEEAKAHFQAGKKCLVEYVAADRALIEFAASVSNLFNTGLELRLEGAIQRRQQRQFFRKSIQLNVRYRFPGDFFRVTQTIDLSGGGAKLVGVPTTLGLGDEFEMVLILPQRQYLLQARIQWQRTLSPDKQEVGVLFIDISPQEQEEIVMFLFGGL